MPVRLDERVLRVFYWKVGRFTLWVDEDLPWFILATGVGVVLGRCT